MVDATGDATTPLTVGAAVPFGAYAVIDYLGASSETLGHGFVELSRYFRLVTHNVVWHVAADDRQAHVELESRHVEDEDRCGFTQYTLGVTLGRFRQAVSGALELSRVELFCKRPDDPTAHRHFFGCPVDYGSARTRLWFPRKSWDLPLRRYEPALVGVLQQHADHLLEQRPADDSALADVRQHVRAHLHEGPRKLDAVARQLAVSTRTLQRRLREAGTTFQRLTEEERQRAAMRYLDNPDLAVGEVAYMLGYSEPSAFVRAFKRWTGQSPRRFRDGGREPAAG
jgi:AraC-like DNA-binding protein